MIRVARDRREPADLIGASVLSALVLGLAVVLGAGLGWGGGRAGIMLFVLLPAVVIWGLWQMVGAKRSSIRRCKACGRQM